MVKIDKLIASFEEIIGWLYVSPGTNDKNGIDCSGAFVRAYRAQGASIYHGSNTIFRQYCSETGRVTGVSSLRPGMAVFKQRSDNGEPVKYRGDGHGNMYHIGLVVSVNPLRIIHATPPKAKVDTSLGNWSHYGFLKDVNYGEGGETMVAEVLYTATVTAESGSTVNLRKTQNGDLLIRVPIGTRVTVLSEAGEWVKAQYGEYMGYMKKQFLKDVDNNPDESVEGSLEMRFLSFLTELESLIKRYRNTEES